MSPEVEAGLRLLLAAVLGGLIGFQREFCHRPAGLRTHILICMGSALFTVVSIMGFEGTVDPARVAAGVVTGIGFIGAGVIFRGLKGDAHVVGLTTAASIWVTAAIGIAAGAGMYIIATIVAVVTFLVLIIPKVKG
ncbi:MAG: MgtC/SapB family protein [Dehalococcoidia bacterium]|nr:MgtC/SapB family protein [Dehalococcoidia bacterium]